MTDLWVNVSFCNENIKREISHLKTYQNKLTSQKFQLRLIQWAFCSVAIFISRRLFFFLHVVCIYLFKFFGHPISFCPTSLGIANLLTALAVSRLANPEANLGALVICFCTFDIFLKDNLVNVFHNFPLNMALCLKVSLKPLNRLNTLLSCLL